MDLRQLRDNWHAFGERRPLESILNPAVIMELRQLQEHWNEFAETDPLWAILSTPDRRNGKWDPDDFFRTGEQEVARVLAHVRGIGLSPANGRALDFGCGVGRLTQALCQHFARCSGADIAPSMIAQARRFNRHGERCEYHLNEADDLRLFADATFDFIYSNIVLQHMHPRYAKRYISEFLRILSPRGGVAVFQVPSELAAGTAGSDRGRPGADAPLPESAYRAALTVDRPPRSAVAGAHLTVRASVTNAGGVTWPGGDGGGRYPVRLGNHWRDADGRMVALDDGRTNLPADLEPGGRAEMELAVQVPAAPGRYLLELDMVQELIAWFGDKGSATAKVPIEVTPVAASVPAADAAAPPAADGAGTGAAKVLVPKMEMYGIPRPEVEQWVAAHGGRVVDVTEDAFAGPGWVSCRYCVTKAGNDGRLA